MHRCPAASLLFIAFLLLAGLAPARTNAQDRGASSLAKPDSIGFRPGPVSNFLIEISWPREGVDGVFVLRPYEVRITPRDRFLNPVDSLLRVRLTARYTGEFDAASRGFFHYSLELQGPYTLRLVSNTERLNREMLQWLQVYCEDSVHISGRSDPFSVMPHAPSRFVLLWPAAEDSIASVLPAQHYTFRWERPDPADPYTDMRFAFENPALLSDDVRYTCVITNEAQNQSFRLPADSGGHLPRRTFKGIDFWNYSTALGSEQLFWYVEATDGVYTTRSTPHLSPFTVSFGVDVADETSAPRSADLGHSFPSPFREATVIPFRIANAAAVRATVHDLLGRHVRTLAAGQHSPGAHHLRWDGRDDLGRRLPAGVYLLRMRVGGQVFTRTLMYAR